MDDLGRDAGWCLVSMAGFVVVPADVPSSASTPVPPLFPLFETGVVGGVCSTWFVVCGFSLVLLLWPPGVKLDLLAVGW